MYTLNDTEVNIDEAYKVLSKIVDASANWITNKDNVTGQDNDWRFISDVIDVLKKFNYFDPKKYY